MAVETQFQLIFLLELGDPNFVLLNLCNIMDFLMILMKGHSLLRSESAVHKYMMYFKGLFFF